MNERNQNLLILLVGVLVMGHALADPATGKKLFKQQGCLGCHYTDGPAREKTIDEQLAKKGPELFYAGSKFQRPWLAAWLQDPQPIRILKYNDLSRPNPGNHPKLNTQQAAQVTDFLMSLTVPEVVAGQVKPKKNPKGRLIFRKKMPCAGCHQYPDRKKILGGRSGPSLVGAGRRLNPDWIYAYMLQPKVFKPVKDMPVFTGLMSDRDIHALVAHIASFK